MHVSGRGLNPDLLHTSLRKVGWILSFSTKERDFIMSTDEVCQMAANMEEVGEHAVTVIVALADSEDGKYVHFEAFQCSQQAHKLYKEGWFRQDVVRHRTVRRTGGDRFWGSEQHRAKVASIPTL